MSDSPGGSLLVATEEGLEEVGPAHDARDLASLIDDHEAADVALLHQARRLSNTDRGRHRYRRPGHEVDGHEEPFGVGALGSTAILEQQVRLRHYAERDAVLINDRDRADAVLLDQP